MSFRFPALFITCVFIFSANGSVNAVETQVENQSTQNAAEKTAQTVCAACHGVYGNSIIALNPKLAGQQAIYLLKQLRNFKDGTRANGVMSGMVANLTLEEMRALSDYYAARKSTLAKAKTNGAGSLGEKIYRGGIAATQVPACAACHGANGEGIPKRFPRVSGQHANYSHQQLNDFRTDARANAAMMQAIAKKMTEAEMQAVADYMQGLR